MAATHKPTMRLAQLRSDRDRYQGIKAELELEYNALNSIDSGEQSDFDMISQVRLNMDKVGALIGAINVMISGWNEEQQSANKATKDTTNQLS